MEDRCKEKILSEDYWDFIISPYREDELEGVDTEKMCIQELDFGYKSVSLDSRMLLPLSLRQYWYGAIPKCYTLLDMQPLDAAGIFTLQNYPTLQLMGEGIMIGFLDTGIDYTHPVFRNLDGTTRIAGIWDQTIQDGDPPEGFLYGTEYTEERINAALHSESPQELISSEDTDGHGTFVASVAAGSAESSGQFLGAAPEAVIAMVKLKPAKEYLRRFYYIPEGAKAYQENDIMAGVAYLTRLAERYRRPLVIYLGLGSNSGDHSGNSVISYYLNYVSLKRNTAVVVAAGNEATARHHYYGEVAFGQQSDVVEVNVEDPVEGFHIEMWAKAPELYSVQIISPTGERTAGVRVQQDGREVYRFVFENT